MEGREGGFREGEGGKGRETGREGIRELMNSGEGIT